MQQYLPGCHVQVNSKKKTFANFILSLTNVTTFKRTLVEATVDIRGK